MEEIEVPTEQLQETIHEHAEGHGGGGEGRGGGHDGIPSVPRDDSKIRAGEWLARHFFGGN